MLLYQTRRQLKCHHFFPKTPNFLLFSFLPNGAVGLVGLMLTLGGSIASHGRTSSRLTLAVNLIGGGFLHCPFNWLSVLTFLADTVDFGRLISSPAADNGEGAIKSLPSMSLSRKDGEGIGNAVLFVVLELGRLRPEDKCEWIGWLEAVAIGIGGRVDVMAGNTGDSSGDAGLD